MAVTLTSATANAQTPAPAPAPEAPASETAPQPGPPPPEAPAAPEAPQPEAAPEAPVAVAPAVAPSSSEHEIKELPPPRVAIEPYTGRKQLSPVERDIRKQRRAGMGMMISGWTVFGVSYLITAFVGASAIDAAEGRGYDDYEFDRPPSKAYGQRLLIPIAGPFAAAPKARTATGGLGTALGGVVQLAGVSLGIAGTVLYVKAKKRSRKLSFGAAPTLGGGQVTMRMAF